MEPTSDNQAGQAGGSSSPVPMSYYELYVQRSTSQNNKDSLGNSSDSVEMRDWNAECQALIDEVNQPNAPDDQLLRSYRQLARLAQDFSYVILTFSLP